MHYDILEADSILYQIGIRSLLTDVYLQCRTGDLVGLLGRNGCGKSTLLKIIFGSLPTADKHIRINGQVYQSPYKAGLISYLPQNSFLPQSISLQKIIEIFISGVENQQKLKQNKNIQAHLSKRTYQLSGGELRYFELLLLLHLDTKFLLLDEPFSGMEPLFKEKIKDLLLEYRTQKGIILTDHDYRHIFDVSNRLILLTDGYTKPIHNIQELEDWNYIPSGTIAGQ